MRSEKPERLAAQFNAGDPAVTRAMVEDALADAVDTFNPKRIPETGEIDVRSLSIPTSSSTRSPGHREAVRAVAEIKGSSDLR